MTMSRLWRLQAMMAALMPLLLGGCFEVSEEIWIDKDRSAKMELTVTLKGSASLLADVIGDRGGNPFGDARKAAARLRDVPGVKSVRQREEKDGADRIYVWEIEVDDFKVLADANAELARNQREKAVRAPIQITDLGSTAVFTQHLSSEGVNLDASKLGGIAANPMFSGMLKVKEGEAREVIQGRLAGKYMTVILHAPKIISANGEIGKKDRWVMWEVPLAPLLASQGQTEKLQAQFVLKDKDKRPLWKRIILFWR